MTEDAYADRLHDYVDGLLDAQNRAEVDAHLDGCVGCRELVKQLRAIRREAKALPQPEPPERVWESVSDAIRRRNESRGVGASPAVRLYAYRALAFAAVVLLGVAIWLAVERGRGTEPQDSEALVNLVTEELRLAESHYQNAIEGLEQIIAQNEEVLPPQLNAVLNENLDLIEDAIAESREALATEPNSTVAQESLLTALRRKVSLLQNTILLINEVRKGEGASALDLLDKIRETDKSPNPI